MISWAIDENTGYELTGETVFGLTSTNAQGRSIISYVGFTGNLNTLQRELNDAVGVTALQTDNETPQVVYAIDGLRRERMEPGVNIVSVGGQLSKVYKK